jgi:hypothetical protein
MMELVLSSLFAVGGASPQVAQIEPKQGRFVPSQQPGRDGNLEGKGTYASFTPNGKQLAVAEGKKEPRFQCELRND